MKKSNLFFVCGMILLSLLIFYACNSDQTTQSQFTFLNSKEAYFGLERPDSIPRLFAPGIVSTADSIEFAGTFSPDGKEFYFTSRAPEKFNRILYSRYEDKSWTAPELAPFAIQMGDFEPSMMLDGNRIYFASARPLPGTSEYNMTPDIWYADRDSTGWEKPQHFSDSMFYMSFTQNNVMYHYGTGIDRASGFICRRSMVDGVFGNRENLASTYPFFNNAHHPCIAKDENFIIFDTDKLEPNYGQLDMYVCFRQSDGSWGKPVNLGEKINTEFTEMAPFLSPDDKYLFYSTWNKQESDIFWVSAEIIETLRESTQ